MFFMKKLIAMFAIAALALTFATPAVAKEGRGGDDRGERSENTLKNLIKMVERLDDRDDRDDDDDDDDDNLGSRFVLSGTVGSTTSASVVINVQNSRNLPALTNNLATVNVDSDTKFVAGKKNVAAMADVKTGQQIMVVGTVSGTTLTADIVQIKLPKGKVFGEVTAKTDTSVTIKNNVTGVTQTITTDADTDVRINGEEKTLADVQVGDRGFVKFKATLAGMIAKVINLFR